MIDEIVGGLDVAQRWGVAEGQLALASKMINAQPINRVFRQYLDGELDAAAAIEALNTELAAVLSLSVSRRRSSSPSASYF